MQREEGWEPDQKVVVRRTDFPAGLWSDVVMRQHWQVLTRLTVLVLGTLGSSQCISAQIPKLDMSIKQPVPMASVAEEYLLTSINSERASAGLPAVKFDRSLQAAAHGHAMQMARMTTLSHRLEGEPDLSARGASAGARFSRITENVAVGPSVVTMHGALMQSVHHRENILDDQVNSIGIAVVQTADGSLWAVEDFSRSVERVSLDDQEHRVSDLLRSMQVDATPTAEARATCGLPTGYVGARPVLTMRYTTGDLSQMPEPLRARLRSTYARAAAVGACAPSSDYPGTFASYNIAVVLYR